MKTAINSILSLSLDDIDSVKVYKTSKNNYPMHNRGRFANGLMFTIEGNEVYKYADREISAVEGSVLCLPQGKGYDIVLNSEKSNVIMINFTTHNKIDEPFIVNFKKSDMVRKLFFDAERIWEKGDSTANIQCKEKFYKILHSMVIDIESYLPEKNVRKIGPGVDYMMEHYREPGFRVAKLSAVCSLSQRCFNLLFFAIYHCTPKEYVTFLRVNKAKELLSDQSLSINDIAERLGYCDSFHFSKIFKSRVGLSPFRYKKGLGNK